MSACIVRRWLAPLALLGGLASLGALLVACGGGVGTGGTGSFAAGPITGFGSVIVNGIEFDDSAAAVEDGDGGGSSRTALRLGMTVEIEGDAIQSGSARARTIRFDSALVGPVETVDAAAGRFTMLGQAVTVDDTTVFDERLIGRLALLVPGGWAEVYALYDPALQRFRATRVEARLVQPLVYRIRGLVSQLDTTAMTFRIGGASFDYSAVRSSVGEIKNGAFVRLALNRTPLASGTWSVVAFSSAQVAVGDLDEVTLKGLVTAFTSNASFQVDGRPVDASGAQFEGTPALGARVEVEGSVRNGVLRARKVQVRSDDEERAEGFELKGQIDSVSASVPLTFVLRLGNGTTVTVGTSRTDLSYEDGQAADLKAGRKVEVKGVLDASGTALEATQIKFD